MADVCNMTRKTRTRQTRIHAALQSGYCAICHLPYNNLDEHIQSKKHLKLIGEDANYISINGFIDQNSLEPFLSLNGIESIDINGKHIETEYSRITRNSRQRISVERRDQSLLQSPIQHYLRSRKQINYAMSPSLDEDSFNDITLKPPVKDKKPNYKNSISVKDISSEINTNSNIEVWNSGRPKRRSCIRAKRASEDERLIADNKDLYKIEVMPNKLRSGNQLKEIQEIKQSTEIQTTEKDDKGLIVKFKKLRNCEVKLLNNEAENFLFPKKNDSSSSSEDEEDADGDTTKVNQDVLPTSDSEDCKPKVDFKVEDEASMDSTTSSGKRRKKRRTHAEAFIMDNQKYYKFETPGSRLRYHGSMFSEIVKSPKRNGEVTLKEEKIEIHPVEKEKDHLNLDKFQFSFETIPSGEKWYSPFRRQDLGEESYMYLPDSGCENRFKLPYQIGPITPLDPRVCISQYVQLKKLIQEHYSASSSRTSCSTPESSEINYSPSFDNEAMDEDSKSSEPCNSIEFCSENSNSNEEKIDETVKVRRSRKVAIGKNPRKSPRQHASTLAILSSLIHQRKRRQKDDNSCNSSSTAQKTNTLPPIPEEVPIIKSTSVDYDEILENLYQDCDMESITDEININSQDTVEFSNKLGIIDVLRIYDNLKLNEGFRNNRRFINGTPGRKPGRRKMNKTGWPNRKKGLIRKEQIKERSNSVCNINDTDEEDSNETDCNKLINNEINGNCDLTRVKTKKNNKNIKTIDKVKVKRSFVKVKKKKGGNIKKNNNSVVLSNKKTYKRRMPASPKSPRMLRKPRGKWYKER